MNGCASSGRPHNMSLQTKTPGAGKQPGATIESGRRNFTAPHIARCIACGMLVGASAFFTGVALTRCTSHASHGTITPALKSAGASNTIHTAVATPTDERGFVTSYSLAGAGISSTGQHGLGRDGATRKDARASVCALLTSRPPDARSKAAGGFQSHTGA